jgi:hypothetical protein
MVVGKCEEFDASCTSAELKKLLLRVPDTQRAKQNAGVIANWLSFSQIERDDRLDIGEARRTPDLASTLQCRDMEKGLVKVLEMGTNSDDF